MILQFAANCLRGKALAIKEATNNGPHRFRTESVEGSHVVAKRRSRHCISNAAGEGTELYFLPAARMTTLKSFGNQGGYEQLSYPMPTANCLLRFPWLALAASLEEFGYFLFFHESPFRKLIHHEVLDILIVGAALVRKTLEALVDKCHE